MGAWQGDGIAVSSSSCRRGCCWTPLGHSAAARSCLCHTDSLGAQAPSDVFGVLGDRSDGSTSQVGVQPNTDSGRE